MTKNQQMLGHWGSETETGTGTALEWVLSFVLTEYVCRSLLRHQSNEIVGLGLGAGLKLVTGGAAVRLGQNIEDIRRNSLTDMAWVRRSGCCQ